MNYWLASTESTSVPVIIRRSSQKNDFQSSGNEEVENRVREVNVDVFGVDDTNEGDGLGQEGSVDTNDNRKDDTLTSLREDASNSDTTESEESGYEDIKPPKPTKPVDPSIPRYGKRFRFSNRYVRMQKLEASNETYYPPDHIRDGHLWPIRKELNEQESLVLESQRMRVIRWLPLYENLTAFLDIENDLHKYISPAEMKRLQSLKGEKLTRYRQQLTSRMLEQKRRENRSSREKRRKKLARQVKRVEGGVCEGCTMPEREIHIDEKEVTNIFIRKFIGNTEVKMNQNSMYLVMNSIQMCILRKILLIKYVVSV